MPLSFRLITLVLFLTSASSTVAWEPFEDTQVVKTLLIEHSNLVDPFSVQFRKMKYQFIEKTKAQMWCGDINAKNRRGAYSGWSAFYVLKNSEGEVKTMIVDEDSAYSGILVTKLCEMED